MHAELEQRLRYCRNLPSPPAVAVRIIDLAQDPEAGLGEVAEVIAHDPALAAKLLKMANSSFYAQHHHCDNLRQALNLLGLDAAVTLALSFSLRTSDSPAPQAAVERDRYWRRCLLAATACRAIAQQQCPNAQEEGFLAGLLQDIGMLVLERVMPQQYHRLLVQAPDHGQLVAAEREHLGTDHGEVGAWLLHCWGLPEYLRWAVAASNDPEGVDVPPPHRPIACWVAASGRLADVWLSPGEAKTLEQALNAVRHWLDWDEAACQGVLEAMGEQLPTISALFELQVVEPAQIAGILDEARELLMMRGLQSLGQIDVLQQRVTDLACRTARLEVESHLDALTGLYNRRHLEARLAQEFTTALNRDRPLGLAFLDLDHFKAVNDTYGHPVGDQVLVSVARRLAHYLRQTDLLARYGGEEFVILLPGTPQASAQTLLERLLCQLREHPIRVSETQTLTITTSIGLATCPDGGNFQQAGDLLRAADQALYEAKRAGRNRLIVYQGHSG